MPELPEIVQALLEPKAYPEPTQGVELVQIYLKAAKAMIFWMAARTSLTI